MTMTGGVGEVDITWVERDRSLYNTVGTIKALR